MRSILKKRLFYDRRYLCSYNGFARDSNAMLKQYKFQNCKV